MILSFKPVMGPLSAADGMAQRLLRRWVPKWYSSFARPGTALFYERLGQGFQPVSTGRQRLLSQVRQLAMYAHAARQPECRRFFQPDLGGHFRAILALYRKGRGGGWVFSLDEAGAVSDATLDLYVHAFVIFACSHYARATGDDTARQVALDVAALIDGAFRQPGGRGFVEALDASGAPVGGLPRRHESHMHLLEACLFAHDAWPDEAVFVKLADEIVDLFFDRFYDAGSNLLSEYFTDDLVPAPDVQRGVIVHEPGHYYEWIWLLKKHAAIKGDPARYDAVCLALLSWANGYGWDADFGGIYDELDARGQVVADTKRLWPFTEAIKANALMLDAAPPPMRAAIKAHVARMTAVFRSFYMRERGFWTEWLNRDLTPAADYMPATTPYHVYFGIMEARDALAGRGRSVSLRAAPRRLAYAVRRYLSAAVRRLR